MKSESSMVDSIIDRIRTEHNVPQLFIVSDKNDVTQINQYVDYLNSEKNRREDESNQLEDSLGRRYRRGDKSAISEIIEILRNADSLAISDLSNKMFYGSYTTEDSVLYLDDSIEEVLFPLIKNPELELEVVNFMGCLKVNGYVDLFESRLLSGESTVDEFIFRFLGLDAKSEKALDYFLAKKLKGNIHILSEGLISFLKKGSFQIKSKVLNFMIEFVENNPVKECFFTVKTVTTHDYIETKSFSLKENNEWNIISSYIYSIIVYGNKEHTNRLINNLLKDLDNFTNREEYKTFLKKQYDEILFTAFDTPKQVEIIKNTDLNTHVLVSNSFSRFSNIVLSYKKFEKELYIAVFKKFNSHEEITLRLARTFVLKFKYLPDFIELTQENITHKEAKQEMIEYYNLINQTEEVMDKYLEENGLVKNISGTVAPEEFVLLYDEFPVFKSLEKEGIIMKFLNDVEDFYDEVILNFVALTKGKLSGVKASWDFPYNRFRGKTEIRVFVTYKDKCYILILESNRYKYDETSILNLINVLLREEDIKEEFVAINSISKSLSFYIFGDRKKVEKLINDYRLNYTYDISY
ncbi:hypothetical protein [Flavobacterium beibuense]|uniref:hypothetical protein n=1 Tax=Flavobacterium beibuense TaxID=657326 RepID=UPI003A8FB314